MKNKITRNILISTLVFVAAGAFAGPPMKPAAEAIESAPDPKKKKAGEECKVSTECPRHYICSPAGEKNVCTVSPLPVPPT